MSASWKHKTNFKIKKGYIKDEDICSVSNTADKSMLNMPTISKAEISGLNRTFSFYVKFPENRWDEIKVAENNNESGNAMFKKLGMEFDKTYRNYSDKADLH